MSDLISKSKLMDYFTNLKNAATTLQDAIFLDGAMAVIDNAPIIDTTLIHCKDCHFWTGHIGSNTYRGICQRFNAITSRTAYCSYGERRESEGNND